MPCSIMCPSFMTRMREAFLMVESLWATTKLVRPFMRVSKACWMRISVRVSMLEVASSRMSIGGWHSMTRAMHSSCFWPWLMPSSDRMVSRLFGSLWMNSQQCEALAASMISSSEASGLPKRMFSLTVSPLSQVSWRTIP